MNSWPLQTPQAMNAYYGNPDLDADGVPDRIWEAERITMVKPPYPMVLAWDVTKPLSFIRCHNKVAASLLAVLHGIADHYGSQEEIEKARMHLYGGAYAFRLKRGGHSLSIHSWGAAIDLDPEHNQFGGKSTMPPAVVALFDAEGWTWGGGWHPCDGMHFQAAHL